MNPRYDAFKAEHGSDKDAWDDEVWDEYRHMCAAEEKDPAPTTLVVTSRSGFVPHGWLNGRPVELSYALSADGDWRYVDEARGWVDSRDVELVV